MRKVDVGTEENPGYDWIAHPMARPSDDLGKKLVKNRAKIEVLWEINDDYAGYTFDDFALIRLGREYYLLNTSGCSCPSPCENWLVVAGPRLKDIKQYIADESKDSYGVISRQKEQFAAAMKSYRSVRILTLIMPNRT